MELGAIDRSMNRQKELGGLGGMLSSSNKDNAVQRIVHGAGVKATEGVGSVSDKDFRSVMKDALAAGPGASVNTVSPVYFDNQAQVGISGVNNIV